MVVLAMLSCGGPKAAPARDQQTDPPGPAQRTTAPQIEQTPDGRMVAYRTTQRWCYVDKDTQIDGGCDVDPARCGAMRTKSIENTMWSLYEKLPKERRDLPESRSEQARIAVDTWKPCEAAPAAACLWGTHVLSGLVVEICAPSIQACERTLEYARYQKDISLQSQTCYVSRLREQ